MDLVTIAKAYAHAGLSVIPTRADKRPACAWKTYTERIMSDREIEAFFGRANGIGIVCGKVSGNLELLDFDDKGSAFEAWFCDIPEHLAKKLVVETSPSGGKHVYYKVRSNKEDGKSVDGLSSECAVPGNRKLAMTKDNRVLIETRGEGGYVKCAPSVGYELMAGDFLHIPTISQLEHQLLIDASREADALRGVSMKPSMPQMEQALVDAGWKKVCEGKEQHWERPGKNERSTSATFNGEVFYVFSSNAAPFEPNKGYSPRHVIKVLNDGFIGEGVGERCTKEVKNSTVHLHLQPAPEIPDPGPLPEALLHVPGFVDLLTAHTLDMAPYPNRPLAFAGALSMLAHLTGRNFRDVRNLRTNIYLLALADSGVGKDVIRKVNMNLATEVGIMPTMADRFASAEGLEDALLIHPASFFQVDEVDTLFAALQEKKDSAIEKIYSALLQFATSSDTTYAMRKKAIQQAGGKACKFDRIRARGIREPHLTMLGCAIPKYLYSALSERAMENGLMSRCLILEAGARGKAGTPHFKAFDPEILDQARHLVSLGGFEGLDLENLEVGSNDYHEPYTVSETSDATIRHDEVTRRCEELYNAADSQAGKALWARGAEKASRLALLHAISENVREPLITPEAVDWSWAVVEHLTRRMLYQASVYVHDNEFDALRQKALRYLRDYGNAGTLRHGQLLKRMHIDADTFRRVIDTLEQSELIVAKKLEKGGFEYRMA